MLAAAFAVVAVFVTGPAVVYAMGGPGSQVASGRPFATYDTEVFLLGIAVTPGAGKVLAYIVSPVLLAISVLIAVREARACRPHNHRV